VFVCACNSLPPINHTTFYNCMCTCLCLYACVCVCVCVSERTSLQFVAREAGEKSVYECVAVCCSVLQCVAVCCSVLQCAVHKAGEKSVS